MHIYNKTPNFACVSLLSTEQLFFSTDVAPSGTPHNLRQKYTSEHRFYRAAPSDCFRNILLSFENSLLEMKIKQN